MKKMIDEKDLARLAKDGAVEVTREMILSPTAREYAARQGIKLSYQEAKTKAQAPLDGTSLGKLIEDVVIQELVSRASEEPPPPPPPPLASPPQTLGEQLDAAVAGGVLGASSHDGSTVGRAVIAAVGANRPGIVARISTAVASAGGDLADMNQVIVDDYFSLIFVVDLAGLEARGVSFRIFKERLKDEAAAIGQVEVLVMHEEIFRAMHKV